MVAEGNVTDRQRPRIRHSAPVGEGQSPLARETSRISQDCLSSMVPRESGATDMAPDIIQYIVIIHEAAPTTTFVVVLAISCLRADILHSSQAIPRMDSLAIFGSFLTDR